MASAVNGGPGPSGVREGSGPGPINEELQLKKLATIVKSIMSKYMRGKEISLPHWCINCDRYAQIKEQCHSQ